MPKPTSGPGAQNLPDSNIPAYPNRIRVIDTLRGVAALLVCIFHFIQFTDHFVQNEVVLEITGLGSKGVQMFFLISGIVIPFSMLRMQYTYALWGRFLLKRLIRLDPPYLAAMVLSAVYIYAGGIVFLPLTLTTIPSLQDILLHIGYLVPFFPDPKWVNPVFWTLSVEFQYYIFISLLFPLAIRVGQLARIIFLIAVVAPPFFTYHASFFTHWSGLFGLGIYYILYKQQTYTKAEFILAITLCSLATLYRQGWQDLLVAYTTLAVIDLFRDHATKLGDFLGQISYSLYLLHTITGSVFVYLLAPYTTNLWGQFWVTSGGVLVSIGAAYICWYAIERPSQALSRNIRLRLPHKLDSSSQNS